MKRCAACKVSKELDAFPVDRSKRDGHYYKCKDCARVYYQTHRKKIAWRAKSKRYGVTASYLIGLWDGQEGRCAICRVDLIDLQTAHVDHCHETGKVRGLLCKKCNSGLGLFDDVVDRVRRAATYLESHNPTAKEQL